jgi:hypothetical protein
MTCAGLMSAFSNASMGIVYQHARVESDLFVAGDARELGKTEYLFVRNVGNGDAHNNRQQMVFAQADFLDVLNDNHIVADGLGTLSLEQLRQLIGFHPRAFGHFH